MEYAKKHMRRASLVLALLLLLPLTACGEKKPAGAKDGTTAVLDTSRPEESTAKAEEKLVLDKTDLDGAALRVLGTGESYGYGYYEVKDIWAAEDSAEAMESAVYRRALACEEKYNFKIDFRQSNSVRSDVSMQVSSSLDEEDLFFEGWGALFAMSKAGYMRDLQEIPTLDLSNEWWDQNANKDLTLGNRLFYTTGEMTTMDDQMTRYLYFNKNMVEDHHLADPYALVREGKWTLDRFGEMASAVTDDVNGDGVLNYEDTFGLFFELTSPQFFILGCGRKYVTLDADGYPQYTFLQDSEDYTVLERVAEVLSKPTVYNVNDYVDLGEYSNRFSYARSLFAAGRHLFTLGGADVITEFREMEDEFGILPLPKYKEEQKRYYHMIDTYTPLFAVPVTVADTGDLGYMMDYFSYEGMKTLTPVFRETLLERKYTRDADSAEMLKLIFDSKAYDLAVVADWANIVNIANASIDMGRVPKMSSYEKAATMMDRQIRADYEAICNLGK